MTRLLWSDRAAMALVCKARLEVSKERGLCKTWFRLGRILVYLQHRRNEQGDYNEEDHRRNRALRSDGRFLCGDEANTTTTRAKSA